MKPTDRNRRDLLEELFSMEKIGNSPGLDELLDAIRNEKRARCRRRRLLVAGACAGLLVTMALWPWHRSAPERFDDRVKALAVAMPEPDQQHAPEPPFQVERVDDEGLLKLLVETPAALVEWSDGRSALMLVVHTSTTP
jgi:hypothetical protein